MRLVIRLLRSSEPLNACAENRLSQKPEEDVSAIHRWLSATLIAPGLFWVGARGDRVSKSKLATRGSGKNCARRTLRSYSSAPFHPCVLRPRCRLCRRAYRPRRQGRGDLCHAIPPPRRRALTLKQVHGSAASLDRTIPV